MPRPVCRDDRVGVSSRCTATNGLFSRIITFVQPSKIQVIIARSIIIADPQAARARRAADRERIADLAARIVDLECSIRALRAEQETVQERLDAYTYPVLTLPPDLVSDIFVHFLPVYPKRAPHTGLLSPITLGQICRPWREIAFSTPQLWRTFKLVLPARDSKRSGQADHVHMAMEAALCRSRSCPLSVELRCNRFETTPLFETIIAHRACWQHLRLFVLVANLVAIEGPFPLLRSLTTTVWISTIEDARRRSTAFRASPLLHRVAIAQYEEVFRDMLPWSQLTVLLIQSIQIKQCLTILALAPLLVYCDVTFSRHEEGVDTEDDMSRSHIGLAHMKHLKLRGPRQLLNPLSILSLPALQRLHIDEVSLQPNPIAALRSLLSHWGSRPQEIRIGFPSLPGIDYACQRRPWVGLMLASANVGLMLASANVPTRTLNPVSIPQQSYSVYDLLALQSQDNH
ncbi:hypothetical protein B0H16DRAFT_1853033 [Mycena metata]|uniref:F-box domain-containing protein n=1 Tax=Mycena metata TaxID=1033252 RepID=A0AAD7DKT1_9AGAR|nr:hypothetical protein B0H16DRAFT_1853033 [Mycena metata]